MVGQHDTARADANGRGALGNMRDQDGRGGARDPRHVVVLGEPVPPKAPTLRVLGKLQGVAIGLRGVATLDDGGKIKNREGNQPVALAMSQLGNARPDLLPGSATVA
jgi:hypothetical protein